MLTYKSDKLTLGTDFLDDEYGRLTLNDLPSPQPKHQARLTNSSPILERLWTCALYDAESNILMREGKPYFCAGGRGQGWNGMIFTRDQAYASILGLGTFFPEQMHSCIEVSRKVRLELGLRTPNDHTMPRFKMPVEDITHEQFREKYGTNPYCRRTDDVVWLWWADELFKKYYDTTADWQWLYETGKRCFAELYQPFFDETDGLYHGQASFIDIGYNGYPPDMPYQTIDALRRSVAIKASSTNALYYRGLLVMETCAKRLQLNDEAVEWADKAAALRQSFRAGFIRSDGGITYFLHEDGHPEPRREALGTAFAVLHDLLDKDEAIAAFKNYPEAWWGVPLFTPFYDTDATYHNNSAWPFVNSFYLRAKARATGMDTLPYELALLVRSCHGDTFHELTSARNGAPSGKEAQLWTIGPFLHAAALTGTVEM